MKRMTCRTIHIWLILFGGLVFELQAQKQPPKEPQSFTDFIPSENIDPKREMNPNKHRPERRNISYLYKDDSKGVYFGNPCVMEATRSMGFEYVLQVKGVPGSISEDDQFENNVLVKTKLVFTRSPFWKLILNRKIKACLEQSGDFVG